MTCTRIAVAITLLSAAVGNRLIAQPILDRVEQQVRDQVDAAKTPAAAPQPPPRGAEPGYLGLIADDSQGRGVRIVEIVPTGPAAKAGLRTGDLISSLAGAKVHTMDDVARAMQGKTEGAKLVIAVIRAGGEEPHEVTLGRRPQAPPGPGKFAGPLRQPSPTPSAAQQGPRLGLRTLPVSDEVRQRNKLNSAQGAVVVSLSAGGPAQRAGIPLGAVIVAIDGGAVDSPQDLAAAVAAAGPREVELSYIADGEMARKRVMLGAARAPSGAAKLQLPERSVEGPPNFTPAEGPALTAPDDARTATLEARIRALEERLEKLEAALVPDGN